MKTFLSELKNIIIAALVIAVIVLLLLTQCRGTKCPEPSTDTITIEQANIIMRSDFMWAIDYAISFGYRQRNYEQLAVAHAIYCLGYGKVKKIDGDGFREHILNYSGYWKDGKLIKGGSIEKSRIFELKLYNKRY
jgi:hypothetical protein